MNKILKKSAMVLIVGLALVNIHQLFKPDFISTSLQELGFEINSANAEDDYSGLFWHDVRTPVTCPSTFWERTDYYGGNGALLGYYLCQAGAVKSTYSGYFYTEVHTSGGTPERTLHTVECPDGWDPFCTVITDPCK